MWFLPCVLKMWIVHKEQTKKKAVWNQIFVYYRILLSHLTLPLVPTQNIQKMKKDCPSAQAEVFQRGEKTRKSAKPSVCQCRKTELKEKKEEEKKKKNNTLCLLSLPPHQFRASDHQRAPGRQQSHTRHTRVWFTGRPRGCGPALGPGRLCHAFCTGQPASAM